MRGYKTIYVLPNLFTTASLFCGFYAILQAVNASLLATNGGLDAANGAFVSAAQLIFIAMIFDGLDGRVARLTKTESAFGVQYDSLADLVSFGVSPALIIYLWSLHFTTSEPFFPEKLGWLTAFVYTTCAALRLARFNVQTGSVDKAIFIGLPSPAAAAVVAGYVWVGSKYHWSPTLLLGLSLALTLSSALAMVSNFAYYSFKTFKLQSRIRFSKAIIPALIIGLIFLAPAPVLFILFTAYMIHGPIWSLVRWLKRYKQW